MNNYNNSYEKGKCVIHGESNPPQFKPAHPKGGHARGDPSGPGLLCGPGPVKVQKPLLFGVRHE